MSGLYVFYYHGKQKHAEYWIMVIQCFLNFSPKKSEYSDA